MTLNGFEKQDFQTFFIDGLEQRMEAIQSRIQPKFQALGNELVPYLAAQLGNDMYLHIAKHARRTVNPPKDTWLAICDNKRGYKKHPHFQVGLFDDHLFIWLAFIYELPNKAEFAKAMIEEFEEIKRLPDNYVVSLDHTKKESIPLQELKLPHLERFRDVKKGEFLLGIHLDTNDQKVKDGDLLLATIKDTFKLLIPFYKKALKTRISV